MDQFELQEKLSMEFIKAVTVLPASFKEQISKSAINSTGAEKKILKRIVQNCDIADEKTLPLCQDTGIFEIWFRIGDSSEFVGYNLNKISENALKKAYESGLFRESMSELKPVVHIEYTSGNSLEVILTARGFGSENYSSLHMLNPETEFNDIMEIVIKELKKSAGSVCFPCFIGIGLGGTASKAVELSCLALAEMDFVYSDQEKALLDAANDLFIGAGALGGNTSALGVKIKYFPKHIAGLALGIHIGCWCNRIRKFIC